MIRLTLDGHRHTYPVSDVLRLFFGPVHPVSDAVLEAGNGRPDIRAYSLLRPAAGGRVHVETVTAGEEAEKAVRISADVASADQKREVKRQLYAALSEWSGIRFPWGSLTGIRPTLVARECLQETADRTADAAALLEDRYGVDGGKARLAVETALREDAVLAKVPEKRGQCLYFGSVLPQPLPVLLVHHEGQPGG